MPQLGSEGAAGGMGARDQLQRILESPGFARNERLSRFLRMIIERHLERRDDELKESPRTARGRRTSLSARAVCCWAKGELTMPYEFSRQPRIHGISATPMGAPGGAMMSKSLQPFRAGCSNRF
jgi:hypothetical protein